ncbi:hypothetical protein JRQ81_005225 [Phrynocephalus forsythii]|uniref:non-specific serine/threonine protein kinase n=1 Tax=Phrynocephalus forsythii TaxID=171643 RepID=A0A9Q0Y2Q4_9SAUR|nr:hypothetical protein JRQ81_005225 [Phrynocephalus forsythii]
MSNFVICLQTGRDSASSVFFFNWQGPGNKHSFPLLPAFVPLNTCERAQKRRPARQNPTFPLTRSFRQEAGFPLPCPRPIGYFPKERRRRSNRISQSEGSRCPLLAPPRPPRRCDWARRASRLDGDVAGREKGASRDGRAIRGEGRSGQVCSEWGPPAASWGEMPPKRKGKYNLPVPLQEGIILKDTEKREWRLGRMIAQGGFGLIYLASPRIDRPVDDKAEHVIKVEYLENGPLFSELKFYQRAAKQEDTELNISPWCCDSYRFMVMERLGEDLQTTFERKGRKFSKEMVLHLGVRMLNVLEYIHEREYVHGDIKAANLLFGYKNPHERFNMARSFDAKLKISFWCAQYTCNAITFTSCFGRTGPTQFAK